MTKEICERIEKKFKRLIESSESTNSEIISTLKNYQTITKANEIERSGIFKVTESEDALSWAFWFIRNANSGPARATIDSKKNLSSTEKNIKEINRIVDIANANMAEEKKVEPLFELYKILKNKKDTESCLDTANMESQDGLLEFCEWINQVQDVKSDSRDKNMTSDQFFQKKFEQNYKNASADQKEKLISAYQKKPDKEKIKRFEIIAKNGKLTIPEGESLFPEFAMSVENKKNTFGFKPIDIYDALIDKKTPLIQVWDEKAILSSSKEYKLSEINQGFVESLFKKSSGGFNKQELEDDGSFFYKWSQKKFKDSLLERRFKGKSPIYEEKYLLQASLLTPSELEKFYKGKKKDITSYEDPHSKIGSFAVRFKRLLNLFNLLDKNKKVLIAGGEGEFYCMCNKENLIQAFKQSIDERVKAGEYAEECAEADLNSIEKMGLLNKEDIKRIFSIEAQVLPQTGLDKKSSLKETFKIAINSKITRLGGKENGEVSAREPATGLGALQGVELGAHHKKKWTKSKTSHIRKLWP